MNLRTRFNLVILLVVAGGFLVTAGLSWKLLQGNAREGVIQNAELMMEIAFAIRSYTVSQVRPALEPALKTSFLPQTVPAFAATETLSGVRAKYPEYEYKEACLNPTNPRDRATDWEADVIRHFRANPTQVEMVGERETPAGRSLYVARPIQVKDEACLKCHSTPAAAPATMIKLYGDANGFSWALKEIVGTQVVSVPMAVPVAMANRSFSAVMMCVLLVFVVLFLALNVLLTRLIINPLVQMAHVANEVSTGNFQVPEFARDGQDEVGSLGDSFNRMRRSLQKALQMLGG
jgi:HAMP domain-containing protein